MFVHLCLGLIYGLNLKPRVLTDSPLPRDDFNKAKGTLAAECRWKYHITQGPPWVHLDPPRP